MSDKTTNKGDPGTGRVSPLMRLGPGGPRKRANATTSVTIADFTNDDEVTNLLAVKRRLSEMLARPDLLERDLAALNKDYRKLIIELNDARTRAASANLGAGRRRGLKAVPRSIDGDI